MRNSETLASDPDKALDLSLAPGQTYVTSLRQVCEAGKKQGRGRSSSPSTTSSSSIGPAKTMCAADARHGRLYREDRPDRQVRRAVWAGLGTELDDASGNRPGYRAGDRRVGRVDAISQRAPRPRQRRVQRPIVAALAVDEQQRPLRPGRRRRARLCLSRRPVRGTPYRVVPEESITEITGHGQSRGVGGIHADGFPATRIRVHGTGKTDRPGSIACWSCRCTARRRWTSSPTRRCRT